MDIDAGPDSDAFEEEREDVDRPMLRLFTEYGGDRKGYFAAGLASSILARVLDLLPPLLLAVAIDSVFRNEAGFSIFLLPESWLPTTQVGQLWFTAGIIGTAFLGAAAFHYTRNWGWNRFAQGVQHDIRTDTYETMQTQRLGFFDDHKTGEIMSVLNNDVNQLESFLSQDLQGGVRIVVSSLTIAAFTLWLHWQLALVTLLMVPALGYASYRFQQEIEPKYSEVRSSVGQMNARLENNIGGIKVIKAFGREGYETDRVEEASDDYRTANWSAITTRIKFFPTLTLITAAGYGATFALGGYAYLFGGPFTLALSAGTLVTFLAYARRLMYPMQQFGQVLNNYQYAYAATERIVGLLREPDRVPDRETGVTLESVDGAVEYDHVTFAYDSVDEPTIDDVDLSVDPGETIGLVGPTGAGKTTLTKLLMRLYDPDEGAVRLDDHDVRDLQLSSLRSHLGYVSQEPFLFGGTVRENVAYGQEQVDDGALESALRQAGAWEFVTEMDDGVETVVGERGVKLSGGQRQRLAIARAILEDPSLLILDEATSHVDNETEMIVQQNVSEMVTDRTTFVVAHRLSTVRDADRIVVLDDGVVQAVGTHEELLERDALYADLWRVQVGEVETLPERFLDRQPADD